MLAQLFSDKALKPKEKTDQLAALIQNNELSVADLLTFAHTQKDPVKATCVEAIEFATQQNPAILPDAHFADIIGYLGAKAPRIKWEAAKVIGNTIHLHPTHINAAIQKLLDNTEHDGTVVRWSAAFALSQILKLKLPVNADLVPAAEAIVAREEKNSIKKIYLAALKKIG